MINFPYNMTSNPQNMSNQSGPGQLNQSNFQPFQQPQANIEHLPTPRESINMDPFYQLNQPAMSTMNNQQIRSDRQQTNLCQSAFGTGYANTFPPQTQTQYNNASLPQNILDQIRSYVSNATPIFILPGGCHQSTNHQQPGIFQSTGQQASLNYATPPLVYCSPSFYPYPIPLPIYEPFGAPGHANGRTQNCECRKVHFNPVEFMGDTQRDRGLEWHEHRCTDTTDDTICSKLNCPSSINLQSLASQLLSIPGIISCAATRLILRKIPGSNIMSTMDSTMDSAQRAISALTKDQLLTESRIGQQVNALINLHMTNKPPSNIVPILTLIQLKVNLLKAQVESLINKKIMENQGYASEVDTTKCIDPAILAQKTNDELRRLLSALKEKECEERVNVEFAPYRSQRVIAESRLNDTQNKICQVEAEFERRRNIDIPRVTPTSRIVKQFAESSLCSGCPSSKIFTTESKNEENRFDSPDPFSTKPQNPRRLNLKPHVGSPETTYASTERGVRSKSKDNATEENAKNKSKNKRDNEDVNTDEDEAEDNDDDSNDDEETNGEELTDECSSSSSYHTPPTSTE